MKPRERSEETQPIEETETQEIAELAEEKTMAAGAEPQSDFEAPPDIVIDN